MFSSNRVHSQALLRRILIPLATVATLVAAACTSDMVSAPRGGAAVADRNRTADAPGSHRTGSMLSGQATPLNCSPKNASSGSALIGPSGGSLYIGTNRLIVPPGALDHSVLISGTVPAGKPFQVDLQPHGLHFKKAAGLILDARSCVDVPNIVYLIDQFTVSDPILAVYSNWWHAIACPIWHFSGYSVAFYAGSVDDP